MISQNLRKAIDIIGIWHVHLAEKSSRYIRKPRLLVRSVIASISVLLLYFLFLKSAPKVNFDGLRDNFHILIRLQTGPPVVVEQRHRNERLHFLLPATNPNENLCQVLLSSSILGYNSPVMLGWGAKKMKGITHGGTHALKISQTLDYLKAIDKQQDDDLVILADAYDIQFQLPPKVLIDRYYRVTDDANRRLKADYGKAYDKEKFRQSILFAAAKRYWPNPINEVSTWTAPQSPAPDDIYWNNTDTIIGRNSYWSNRPRFMNSGFIIGPVGDMRKMFKRANKRIRTTVKYHDSDQSVFAIMMGEQNYMREVLRLRHVGWWTKWRHPYTATKPRDNWVRGLHIDNILNPSITHIPFVPNSQTDYEFGMGLDYMLDMAHQTSSSAIGIDSAWITYNKVPDYISYLKPRRKSLDCKMRVHEDLPDDIKSLRAGPYAALHSNGIHHQKRQNSSSTKDDTNLQDDHDTALINRTWYDIPLYTQLCYGTIPIMIHHNGDKSARERNWPDVWLQSHAKQLLEAQMAKHSREQKVAKQIESREKIKKPAGSDWEAFKKRPRVVQPGGSWTGDGKWKDWNDICSPYTKSLFKTSKHKSRSRDT
jgi:hypothetical protein